MLGERDRCQDTMPSGRGSNGVLQSPSVIVSSHLWLFPSLLSCLSSLSLARALAQAPGLIKSRVFEDAIHTPTCSNGVLLSLALSLSLCLCLCRSLFQVCLRLVLPGARRTARSNTCHVGLAPYSRPRGHHWHPNLLEWCPAVTLCHRLFPSPALSLCLCLCPSLFQVCLRLVLPGARRTARSNTCHAGLARSPVGAAPAQQAVQRCARTAGCAALLSHATMAQGPSQTDLAQRALLGASPPWSCQRGAGRPAPDSRGPPPP